jgi:DNA-binding transcriptional ArsR family regulator
MPDQPSFPHPLADPLVDLIAQRFRVLGEPMRIKLLDHLREGDATVSELQEALGASQQNVSKHLGILHAAGMVARTKDGNHTRYSIADEGVFELCEQVCGGVRRQLDELDALLQPLAGRSSTVNTSGPDENRSPYPQHRSRAGLGAGRTRRSSAA